MNSHETVCIGVCTIGRPKMLEKCLGSIQALQQTAHTRTILIVVDNDSRGTARSIVSHAATLGPIETHYVIEPKRGIPCARNRVIEEALKFQPDWVAFVDDDQRVHPDWVEKMLIAARLTSADVVKSASLLVGPKPAPFWSLHRHDDDAAVAAMRSNAASNPLEHRITCAGTCGVFVSSRLLDGTGPRLRFDERLALSGGSDSEFFYQAEKAGAVMYNTTRATMVEEVARSRLTYKRYIARGLAQGGQKAARHRHEKGQASAFRKYFLSSIGRAMRGLGQLVIAPALLAVDLRRFKFTALEGGRNLAWSAGALGGLMKLQYKYYNTIDGY